MSPKLYAIPEQSVFTSFLQTKPNRMPSTVRFTAKDRESMLCYYRAYLLDRSLFNALAFHPSKILIARRPIALALGQPVTSATQTHAATAILPAFPRPNLRPTKPPRRLHALYM
jgi:hypothetical protein